MIPQAFHEKKTSLAIKKISKIIGYSQIKMP
jgi:hypothetical protein